ncbi:MAG: hypothetical protein C0493_11230 [Kytococcus sp.]|nr:hypothetical protein [Kytococcus sp.]
MEPLRIGLAIPLQGPAGIFGPSCEAAAALAVAQLNERSGILGRHVELDVVDAGAPIETFCDLTTKKVRSGELHAVVGWHISSVRQHIAPVLAHHDVPYVYTSLHEGAGQEEVLCSGETPALQVLPGLRWLREQMGIRRWAVVGADYVWPRRTMGAIRHFASLAGIEIVHEETVAYGNRDFRAVLGRIAETHAEGVVMLLVGRDAVLFNRQFGTQGLHERLLRFTPLMEENMLLASGATATRNLFVAAAYFNTLATASALNFGGSYAARFGSAAPALNNAGESCYEGILALAACADAAASPNAKAMLARVADAGVTYEGPRGTVRIGRGESQQAVHIASADDNEFTVLGALPGQPLAG